jgi:cysteinyl-tRNA synthetase
MAKISFDFDGTLEFSGVQDFAKELKAKGHDICILTTRYKDPKDYSKQEGELSEANIESLQKQYDEFYEIAKDCGIEEIHFTNFQWKTTVIDDFEIDVHLDDNFREEVSVINHKNKAKAVLYNFGMSYWKNEVYDLIDQIEKGTEGE